MSDEPPTEDAVLGRGMVRLQALLGESWKVQLVDDPLSGELGAPMQKPDQLVQISAADNSSGRLLVQVELDPQPSRLRETLLPKLELLRLLHGWQASALVIAPWITPQTAELLDTWGVNYLDLTGTVALRMDRPGLIIRVAGATQDPRRRPPAAASRTSGACSNRRPPPTTAATYARTTPPSASSPP